ncbi:MAG: S-adenosylmethionine:tRNA ribosyltransferase-isomerase, partial [Phycisphaeraceae bacterium]|nr:S-adenosylmethionine:tRNA ribosyltransferase-isomerase [Phycisphaeraceae bacterium]
MRTDQLDFHLPEEQIATTPATPRDSARLLVVHRTSGKVTHHHVRDLPDLENGPSEGDLLVFNRTRVVPARFGGHRADTGGKISGLFLSGNEETWEVMLESRGRLQPDEAVELDDGHRLVLLNRLDGG